MGWRVKRCRSGLQTTLTYSSAWLPLQYYQAWSQSDSESWWLFKTRLYGSKACLACGNGAAHLHVGVPVWHRFLYLILCGTIWSFYQMKIHRWMILTGCKFILHIIQVEGVWDVLSTSANYTALVNFKNMTLEQQEMCKNMDSNHPHK